MKISTVCLVQDSDQISEKTSIYFTRTKLLNFCVSK